MQFASDNSSGAAPEIMAALSAINEGYAPSYGADGAMDRVRRLSREIFEAPEAEVYLVNNGTTANALSLATYCPPWGAVYCHEAAHVEVDECGAPEFYIGGGKLVKVRGEDGKMTPETLRRAIEATPQGFVHATQRGAVTLTNVTEAGTVYSVDEMTALCAVAKSYGLPVHLDGARFANALVAADASPADMSWRAGIDILSLGGTKNGCMGVEAVVLFDPSKAWEFELRRKRGGHLFSKHRYLSAQMEAYLTDGLWLKLAAIANARAERLADGIAAFRSAAFLHPRDANMIFAALPRRLHRTLHEAGARYHLWPHAAMLDGPEDDPVGARFVCSWSTTEGDVDAFLAFIRDRD
ncbi:Low specificity L-threonine aldolase [Defluviimonas aquaemixtae]|uniref:L-threonine aldolase n=1 Tax=Albidovulum aquaemixtae TaxID=1542388 RepID=A0A2R8BMV0_9RHOB|nr:low specificity L-threonine aldolase [Defluviimonas aquaemixtae]SPH24749.1 Low specificity L-threonine aldolase [Defluviimonas aquaemixtae]